MRLSEEILLLEMDEEGPWIAHNFDAIIAALELSEAAKECERLGLYHETRNGRVHVGTDTSVVVLGGGYRGMGSTLSEALKAWEVDRDE